MQTLPIKIICLWDKNTVSDFMEKICERLKKICKHFKMEIIHFPKTYYIQINKDNKQQIINDLKLALKNNDETKLFKIGVQIFHDPD
jgi:hypothetical protein